MSAPKPGYEHGDAFDEGFLKMGDIHNVYYAQYGAKDGKPVIFLHGGPGGGTSKDSLVFFDPAVYRVVLLDQRGAGKSTPVAETRENTTQHLIGDIETLREHVGVDKWHMVFGGSWGSTLSLAYAQAHPDRVGSLVVRGVFFGSRAELEWEDVAAAAFYPEVQRTFLDFLPEDLRATPERGYHRLVTATDRATSVPAARIHVAREMKMSTTKTDISDSLAKLEEDDFVLQHARLELHYFVNGCFLEDRQLIQPENIDKIRHIPMSIVNGRLDLLCLPKYAEELHHAIPGSKLYLVPGAGHSAYDPGTLEQLVATCDEYAKLELAC